MTTLCINIWRNSDLITFDIFHNDSPFLVDIDFQQYSVVSFTADPARISCRRPTLDENIFFPIFIVGNNRLQRRADLDVCLKNLMTFFLA